MLNLLTWLNTIPFTFAISAQALTDNSNAVEQAQVFILKKNRQQACAKLREAISTTPTSAKQARGKFISSLNQFARVFFTDKGQKAYEAGQSMMFENPDIAMAQFREALNFEDGNMLILTSLAKVQLMKQDCESAALQIEKARALNPYASDPALLELRTLLCQQHFESFRERAKQLPPLEKWEERYLQFLLAQDLLQQKASKKAFDILSRIAEEQPDFPETYYQMFRAGRDLERDTEPWLRKYASLCKGLTSKERRRFSLEPRLCVNLKEVEDELAQKSRDT